MLRTNFSNYLKKIVKMISQTEKMQLLLQHVCQIETAQILFKQSVEYKFQDLENAHSIELLKLRSFLSNAVNPRSENTHADDSRQVLSENSYEFYLHELEKLHPDIFPVWKACFDTGLISYREEREHSCSTLSNKYVVAFQAFIEQHAFGKLLDQGCGIYGLPVYVKNYPVELISAIEPLEPVTACDFEIVRGFCEFLPWKDNTFSTIVNATSLDHVLCLETAIRETCRVLKQGGKYLVWLASIKGAKPFDYHKRPVAAIDQFHLFHFEDQWFEEMMTPHFDIREKLIFPTPSFDHVFYAFVKK